MILFYVGLIGLGKKNAEYIDTFRINPIGSIKMKTLNQYFNSSLESAKIIIKIRNKKYFWKRLIQLGIIYLYLHNKF